MQYDKTVRNSENTVVQFTYGDDGLNPDKMENNDRPVQFDRVYLSVRERLPCRDEKAINATDLRIIIKSKLQEERYQKILPEGLVLHQDIDSFFEKKSKELAELGGSTEVSMELSRLCWNTCRFTKTQVDEILDDIWQKCVK